MTDSANPGTDKSRSKLVAVAPMGLAVDSCGRDLPLSVTDSKHERVVNQALKWQQAGGHASFWEMGASLQGIGPGKVYALAGLMASTGEQLSLAHAAGIEVALWRDFRKAADPDPTHEMCMRAMGEAQCLFVMGTGHALANVVVRTLAVDPTCAPGLTEKLGSQFSAPNFDPFSQAKRDWASMNPPTCQKIEAVAKSCGDSYLRELVQPIVEFGCGESWKGLVERRGEDFHRWRPQTDGIVGVSRSTPWSGEGGIGVLKIGHRPYDDARGLADETARIATDAMLDIAKAMEGFAERWTPPGSSMRNGLADSMIQ